MAIKPFLAAIAASIMIVTCVHTDYDSSRSVVLKNETDTEIYFSSELLVQEQEIHIQPNSKMTVKTADHEGMDFIFGDNSVRYTANTQYVDRNYRGYNLVFKKENGELVCYVSSDSRLLPFYWKAYGQTRIDEP